MSYHRRVSLAIVILAAMVAALVLVALWRHRRAPRGAPTVIPQAEQHAVVLVHGILGFEHINLLGARQHYFRGIAAHLAEHGAVVHAPSLAPLGSVPERAAALERFVFGLDERRVILIAHSMGGLDARYALSRLRLAERARALVTIATPHHGSCLADVASMLPARAARAFLGQVGLRTDALDWLGEARAPELNQRIQDVSSVVYGCVLGKTSRSQLLENPLLLASHELLRRLRGDNDGLVPVSSQRWGRELCTIDAHHWAQIGWSTRYDARALFLSLVCSLHEGGLPSLSEGDARKALPGDVAAGAQSAKALP